MDLEEVNRISKYFLYIVVLIDLALFVWFEKLSGLNILILIFILALYLIPRIRNRSRNGTIQVKERVYERSFTVGGIVILLLLFQLYLIEMITGTSFSTYDIFLIAFFGYFATVLIANTIQNRFTQ